jgi:acyl-CoA reductase-like NAD-dependent aldehyde dehydrogenase
MEAIARAVDIGSAAIPEGEHTIPPTSRAEVDAALKRLQENKGAWIAVDLPGRIALLEELVRTTERAADRWAAAALRAKKLTAGTPQASEEWLGGPMVTVRNLRLLALALRDVRAVGYPRTPGSPYTRPNGQVVVPVFPNGLFDKMLFSGISAEIWMRPEVTLETLRSTQALIYQKGRKREGKVALVLGAGNVSSIGPMDALYKLFAEDQVVLLKMNPVNEYLGPIFAEALRPLVDRGFLAIAYGGAAEGSYLCQHDLVDEIHITGSDKTHDAIVFGPGAEGKLRKAERSPLNRKPITSELGNVSPILVVPGPWSAGDLDFHGANLASMLTNNAGFNCNATRVVVTDRGWKERPALLDAVRWAFRGAPLRSAYYPGAADRYATFKRAHPEAEEIGAPNEGELPWMIVTGLDPSRRDDVCFTTEAFCSVTSEVALDASSPVDFLERAVAFANETLWGSLNAGIIVHPKSLADPAVARAVEKAIADLRFGSVAVNHWPALSYALVTTTWGAFPGHDLYDVRSGIGVVHNTFLLEDTEKSVVRGPFRLFPKPPWFVTNKNAAEIGERMTRFEGGPSAAKLPGIVWAALRG